MRYRYYYCDFHQCPELIDFLKKNGIQYRESNAGAHRKPLVIFNIWSNKDNAEYCVEELKKMNRFPLVFTEYSESDRMKAELLWLWPQRQKIDVINGAESFDFSCQYTSMMGQICYKHEEQKDIIAIAKEPSTKSTNAFWTVSTGFSEVFVDQHVYKAVKASSLVGVDFQNVRLRNGKYSENIFQMTSQNVISRECVGTGYGEIVEKCCVCGKEQYSINSGEYQLHLDFAKIKMKSDLYVTERIFGAGIAEPLYVISQRFYRLLKENGLTGGAKFSPIVDIS